MADEYDSVIAEMAETKNLAPAPDPYDAAIEEMKSNREQALQRSMYNAREANPDQKAQAYQISKKTKLPVSVVEGNFDEAKKSEWVQSTDIKKLTQKNPKLSSWLEDTDNASLAKDDVENLSKIEHTVKDHSIYDSMINALGHGMAQLNSSLTALPDFAYDVAAYPLNKAYQAFGSDKRLTSKGFRESAGLQDSFAKRYQDDANAFAADVPELQTSITEEISKGNYSDAGKALAVQFVANAPNQAALLLTALATDGATLPLLFAGTTSAAAKNQQNLEEGVDPTQGLPNALATGTIEAGFEQLGTLGVLKTWEGKIAKQFGKEVSKEVFKDLGKTLLYSFAAEGNEEFMTSAAQDFTDYVTGVNPEGLSGIWQRALDAGIIGGVSGGGMTAPTAALSTHVRLQRSAQVKQTQDFYNALGESAEATKLRERLPEKQRELVEHIVKDGPVENVYISPEKIDEYFQSQKISPVSIMSELGVLDQYGFAKESGGDVQIPLGAWTEKMVGTDHYKALANDVKFNPEHLTANELKLENEELQKDLEVQSQEAELDQDQSFDESAARIREEIEGQLEAIGADPDQAALYESTFKALGERTGRDPYELFKSFGLTIGNQPLQGEGQLFNQDAQSFFEGEDLSQRYAALPDSQGGLHIDPDNVRNLHPEYAASREGKIVHLEGTGKAAYQAADRLLEERLASQEPGPVIMTAGGSASGKTTYARQFAQTLSDATAIFDSTAANYNDVKARIEKVLKAGHEVVYDYIYAPFDVALEGDKKRFHEMGRLVDPHTMAYTHASALDTFLRLQEEYKDDPRVSFGFFETTPEGAEPSTIDRANELRYNKNGKSLRSAIRALEKQAKKALENEVRTVKETRARYEEDQASRNRSGNETEDHEGLRRGTGQGDVPSVSEGQTGSVKKYDQSAIRSGAAEIAQIIHDAPQRKPSEKVLAATKLVKEALKNPDKVVLYNSATAERATDIEEIGILPQHGSWIEEVAASTGIDDVESLLKDAPQLAYFDERPEWIFAQIARTLGAQSGDQWTPYTDFSREDVAKNAQLSIVVVDRSDESFKKVTEDGGAFVSLQGEGFGYFENEVGPEPGNVVTEDLIGADAVLSGEDVIQFLKVNYSDILEEFNQSRLEEGADPILFQPGKADPRGQIQISPSEINIQLLKTADRSTFLHETGHFYLEVMKNLAAREDAPDEIKRDFQIIRDWVGTEEGQSFTVEQHEQFARGFEAYLMEGKAPTSALREMFSRFKVWLTQVYRHLKALDVELSDEVRRVFDRLLATDEELEQARLEQGMIPLFLDPAVYGFSPEEANEYMSAIDSARLSADDELRKKVMADIKREETKLFREQRKKIKEEVTAEADSMRVYKTLSILQRGKFIDGSEIPQDSQLGKLSKKILVEQYGEDFVKNRLPKSKVYTTKDTGIHPDVAASILGYESSDQMIQELANSIPKQEFIEREIELRLKEFNPSLIESATLPEEAMQAVHNDKRAKVLKLELKHLLNQNQGTFQKAIKRVAKRMPTDQEIRSLAQKTIGSKQTRDLKPGAFKRAEARFAKEAGVALSKGDLDGAFEAKRKELLNHELYKAVTTARADVQKSMKFFRKLTKADEKLSKSRDMDLVNTGRAVLAAFGIGRDENPPSFYLESMKKYDPEAYESAASQVLSATQNGVGNFKEISYDNFVAMKDSVKALWDLSKSVKEIEIDGKKMSKDLVVEELRGQIDSQKFKEFKVGYEKAATNWDKVKMSLLGAKSSLRRVESWVTAMDADTKGIFRSYLWNPVREATDQFRVQKVKVMEKYRDEILSKIAPRITKEKIRAPEIGYTFRDRAELLGALLHTGNESNLEKLLLGRNWGTQNEDAFVDTSKWDRMVSRFQSEGVLTKEDYDYLQGVWDLFDELKVQSQKAHKEMYGYYFSEITHKEFQTPFGTYKGGYVPAVADPNLTEDARLREDKAILEAQQNSYMYPTTGRGFTKSRVQQYHAPLSIELKLVPRHIDKVLRFSVIEPKVKQVARVVMDRSFRETLGKIDPVVASDMLVPWLQRAASQQIMTPSKSRGGRLIDWFAKQLRTNTGFGIMVGNVVNTMQQYTGLSISSLRVKPTYLKNSLGRYVSSPLEMAKDVAEKSDFMKTRTTTQVIEVEHALNDIIINPNTYEKVRDFAKKHGYFLQQVTQNTVDVVTWSGAYDQAISEGMSEREAVRSADSAVRETQGSFDPEDVSSFETGSPFVRLFSMFYSYFNMQANLLATEGGNIFRELGIAKGKERLAYAYVFGAMVPAILSGLLTQLSSGKLDDDEDGEYLDDLLAIFFGSQISSTLAMVPIAGSLVNTMVNNLNDKRWDDQISASPAFQSLQSVVQLPKTAYGALVEGKNKKGALRDALTTVTLVTGIPVKPLSKPLGYLIDVQDGKTRPDNSLDLARGLMTGKRSN